MPGAFEGFGYFDPTAPKPDPDDLMAGVPRPRPYEHVPTTGEVRNMAPPTDTTRDRIAQGVFDGLFSMPLGGYSAGANLAEGALQGDPWQMAGGALESVFLVPPLAKIASAKGHIKPGGWGSPEALEQARGAWAAGKGNADTWPNHGWARPEEAWGTRHAGPGPQEPVTWLDGEITPKPGGVKGAFPNPSNEPLLKDTHDIPQSFLDTFAGPIDDLRVTGRIRKGDAPYGAVTGYLDQGRWRTQPSIRAQADTPDAYKNVLNHEFEHWAHINSDPMARNPSVAGLKADHEEAIFPRAYQDLANKRQEIMAKNDQLRQAYLADGTQNMDLLSGTDYRSPGLFDTARKLVNKDANYFNQALEQRARESSLRAMWSPEKNKATVPGDPAWWDDSFTNWYEGAWGRQFDLPLEAFRAPKLR